MVKFEFKFDTDIVNVGLGADFAASVEHTRKMIQEAFSAVPVRLASGFRTANEQRALMGLPAALSPDEAVVPLKRRGPTIEEVAGY